MTEPLKATLVDSGVAAWAASSSRISASVSGRTTALSFESVGVSLACSDSVSWRRSHSENTDAASSAADRREMNVASVRIAFMSETVGGTGEGWCFVKCSSAFSSAGDVSLHRRVSSVVPR